MVETPGGGAPGGNADTFKFQPNESRLEFCNNVSVAVRCNQCNYIQFGQCKFYTNWTQTLNSRLINVIKYISDVQRKMA